jgi:hypothetical protein
MGLKGFPWIGGSPGCCLWCGEPFVMEIMLNRDVHGATLVEALDDMRKRSR